MTLDDLIALWNERADIYNQWRDLDTREKVEFATQEKQHHLIYEIDPDADYSDTISDPPQ